MPLHWVGVMRNDTLLAQCGINREGALDKLCTTIVKKAPTAGWEFSSLGGLKAVKFHVYETRSLVWSVACVHDKDANMAKAFLEKLILMTEPLRDSPAWRSGGHLAAQQEFYPMLQQRFDQANSMDRVAAVNEKVGEVKSIMSENIKILLENTDKVEELENKSASLMQQAKVFQKAGRSLKKFYLWQNAKWGAATGGAVTAGVAVITVPAGVAMAGTGAGVGVGLGLAATAGIATGVATTVSRNKKSEDAGSSSGAR